MLSRYIDWKGHRIHVSEAGEGEPLLLIAGLGCNSEMWGPLLAHLPERRMVRFDAPGTGLSGTPVHPVSVPMLAELATAVLDDCAIAQSDVIGYSYGGAVAQQMAFDHEARIRRLVLAATTCGIGAVLGSWRAMSVLATPFRYYSPTYFNRTAPLAYGGRTARRPMIRHQMMLARRAHPPSYYGYALQLLGGMAWSSLGFLDLIPHETLVISGDDDPLIPVANPRMLANRIPRAELAIMEGDGHLFMWDNAEKVGARISRFLQPRRAVADATQLRYGS